LEILKKDKNAFFKAASYAMQAARYLVDGDTSSSEESSGKFLQDHLRMTNSKPPTG
jgi:antirestriction protein ArdC